MAIVLVVGFIVGFVAGYLLGANLNKSKEQDIPKDDNVEVFKFNKYRFYMKKNAYNVLIKKPSKGAENKLILENNTIELFKDGNKEEGDYLIYFNLKENNSDKDNNTYTPRYLKLTKK